jgi:DNA-binding MarR family transcriptional regulator
MGCGVLVRRGVAAPHVTAGRAPAQVQRCACETDRRATDAVLTDAGRAALVAATPGHAALVRRMFFDGLDASQVPALRAALEAIHEQVLRHGTLPPPEFQHRLPGLTADGGPHVSGPAGG